MKIQHTLTSDLNITQFCDGSAYLIHMERLRAARGAKLPDSFNWDPLMYQGVSDKFLLWNENIHPFPEEYGIDFEAEVGVIVNEVPLGTTAENAYKYIKYITIINDISLRKLIPQELAKGFGFFQSKPHSALSKCCHPKLFIKGKFHTDCKLHANMIIELNGERMGKINTAQEMKFDFADLIAHASKTRALSKGTLIGSGTVSSSVRMDGFGCLMERNAVFNDKPEIYLKHGDRIKMYIEGFEDTLIIDQIVQ
jgi:fumarylacetoacetate (FAA) hydrolase